MCGCSRAVPFFAHRSRPNVEDVVPSTQKAALAVVRPGQAQLQSSLTRLSRRQSERRVWNEWNVAYESDNDISDNSRDSKLIELRSIFSQSPWPISWSPVPGNTTGSGCGGRLRRGQCSRGKGQQLAARFGYFAIGCFAISQRLLQSCVERRAEKGGTGWAREPEFLLLPGHEAADTPGRLLKGLAGIAEARHEAVLASLRKGSCRESQVLILGLLLI